MNEDMRSKNSWCGKGKERQLKVKYETNWGGLKGIIIEVIANLENVFGYLDRCLNTYWTSGHKARHSKAK